MKCKRDRKRPLVRDPETVTLARISSITACATLAPVTRQRDTALYEPRQDVRSRLPPWATPIPAPAQNVRAGRLRLVQCICGQHRAMPPALCQPRPLIPCPLTLDLTVGPAITDIFSRPMPTQRHTPGPSSSDLGA
jgi:hypothetical protein